MPVLLEHFQDDRVLLLKLIVANVLVVLIYHAARNEDVFHAILIFGQFFFSSLFYLGGVCLVLIYPLMDFLKVVHLILFRHLDEEVHVFYETSKLQFGKLLFRCVSTFR